MSEADAARRRWLATLTLGAAAAALDRAAVAATRPVAPPSAPGWLVWSDDWVRAALPPPPTTDALAVVADLDVVLMWQTLRTPTLIEEARADAERNAVLWAQWALGGQTLDPSTADLLARVQADLRPLARAANRVDGERPRPAE